MGESKLRNGRLVAASIAFVCACGARSEIETAGPANTTSPSSPSCPDDSGAGGAAIPGCVLQAYEVSGADLGPTTLTIPESGIENSYWLEGWNIAVVGGDGNGHWFQIWGDGIDALACGESLSLDPTTNVEGQEHAVLRWWGTATDYWASTSGTLDVIAYEAPVGLEKRPIHFEIHGASMAPGGTEPGSAPNHATGAFTADLSCRLEKFLHVPPN